ncbi:hypothetical protein L1987_20178 [Smallanthus sonchifolius]|uniref:Uncharacterized protein n=1 Tax=Smallanthus sonchifolius TaxID=185202 RepID=A0ACB9IRJ4_9ASTR|nr:hypothetical protein L1987_20178 [Smallanthus sonchifolius]
MLRGSSCEICCPLICLRGTKLAGKHKKNEIEKVEAEFVEFKAGNLKHRQYTSRFNELTQLVSTEERRIKCHVQRLRPRVRIIVKANTLETFEVVIALSGKVYDDVSAKGPFPSENSKRWPSSTKRRGERWSEQKGKKARVDRPKLCSKCERSHPGECHVGIKLCFRCGKMGNYSRDYFSVARCKKCVGSRHMAKYCRRPAKTELGKERDTGAKETDMPRARTRAYALTHEEARENPDVVLGAFLANNTYA